MIRMKARTLLLYSLAQLALTNILTSAPGDGDGLGLALGDGDGLALGDGDGLGESLGDGLGLGLSLGDGLGLGESLGDGDGDGLGDGAACMWNSTCEMSLQFGPLPTFVAVAVRVPMPETE
jgi:hypothetical protein